MSTALTTVFGNDINVSDQPSLAEIPFTGFPGGHGVTAMNLGTRGRPVVISGRLAATGAGFDASLTNLRDWIADLEALLFAEAADYTYHSQTFSNLKFIRLEVLRDGSGRQYHFNSEGYVICNFVMYGHCLVV